ncbi:MAG: hypothetical protein JSR86_04185 [Proteobacteria bacterium]|nr:hypothetical protein [Pseudomonadota bacterium]
MVFVDVGGATTAAGATTTDVVYALSPAGMVSGQNTTHVAFRYEVNCAASTLHILAITRFGDGPAPAPENPGQAPHAPVADSLDPTILKALCQAPPAGGYGSIGAVLDHARFYAAARAVGGSKPDHRFVTAAAMGGGTAAGGVDAFIDTATLNRHGATVTAQVVSVFLRPLDPRAKPGNYLISSVEYGCAARTHATRFTSLIDPSGAVLQAGLTDAPVAAVKPGTVDDTLLKIACDGAPGLGTPQTTLAAALKVAWADLGRPERER